MEVANLCVCWIYNGLNSANHNQVTVQAVLEDVGTQRKMHM